MANPICKDEIIRFVINSSDTDNLIIATFIAGMQANKNATLYNKEDNVSKPRKPPAGRPA